jgi:hypothetical protein
MTASNDLPSLNKGVASRMDGAAGTVALLPPPPPRHANTDRGVKGRLLDRLLMIGVLALAFLLASLPARNSDVWLHLASGRLLARGQYHFGVDPFAFTTHGVRWVNPSWLYDGMSFLLFQAGGGAALVVAKAVGMALLGWILLLLSRTTQDGEKDGKTWIAALFAALALIVVGSSMPLRPICVSYLFLAVTLWLLETHGAGDPRRSLASWWPLLLLFTLWANLDAWFLLGPLTLGLYLLGTLLSGRERIAQARSLAWLLLAGLAACLLNPHSFRVFALPPLFPFTPEAALLRDDPILSGLLQSPFQMASFRFRDIPHLGRWLYFLLLFLGPLSFLLNGFAARCRDPRALSACLRRLPTWLAFFALSALDASTIPFLAIVAAPLTSLNVQEYLRRRQAPAASALPPAPRRPRGGRILTLTLIVVLLMASWPGWLQGHLREPRGWMVETDSSLVDAVQQAARWRREGRIAERETVFNFSAAAAHYSAWFAPEEQSFWDSRWRLFAAAGDYVTVRRALLGDASALDAARLMLRQRHVTHLLLHDSNPSWTAGVFQRLLRAPSEWAIVFLEGDSVILGWRDPTRLSEPDRFAQERVDFHRRAFQPPEHEWAPAQGPIREPKEPSWRSFWTRATPTISHGSEEAALYLIYFDTLRPSFLAGQRAAWDYGLAAATAGVTPSLAELPRLFLDFTALQVSQEASRPRAGAGMPPRDALAMQLMENYGLQCDEGPPALLLLAIRAARRAIRDNPDDARAYQLLGEGYLHLIHHSRERLAKVDLPPLAHIRQIQAASALHRSLLLQPNRIQPHTDLSVLYQDMGLLDLALHHARQALRLAQTLGPFPGESRQAWQEHLRRMEELVRRLDEDVQRRLNNYELQAVRRSVPEQAVLAREQGLGGKSLEILLASDVAVFGKPGAELELDLLLATGQMDDAREWMAPGQGVDVSEDSSHHFRVLLAAAEGNYQACEEELAQLAASADQPLTVVFDAWRVSPLVRARQEPAVEKSAAALKVSARQTLTLKAAQLVLEMPLQRQTIPWLLTTRVERAEFLESVQAITARIQQRVELDVIRGALALERGEVSQAEALLRRSLSVWGSESDAAGGGGLDFHGRRTAQALFDWLSPRKHGEPQP